MADSVEPVFNAPVTPPIGARFLLPLVLLVSLFYYPLILLLREALGGEDHTFSLEHFYELLQSHTFLKALYNTVTIAGSATAGCLILGFFLSVVLAFIPFPGSRLIGRIIDTFIALPTFLIVLSFTLIYGSAGIVNVSLMNIFHLSLPPLELLYSRWGVVLAEITVYTPFVMRPLLANFSLIETSQLEVASSLGATPGQIIWRIIAPAALPALITGGSLCLLLTINEFGIVLFIGARDVSTLPLMIYSKAIQEFDYTTACTIAIVNIFLSLGLFGLYRSIITWMGGRRAVMV